LGTNQFEITVIIEKSGMKKWYEHYIKEYQQEPLQNKELIEEIRKKVENLLKGQEPEVSVVVIAHNEAKRILPCIHSLASMKTNYSVELIVVSNASTDETLEIATACGVIAINQPHQGVGHARQAGLNIARGKYHLCADGDSLYPSNYVDLMVNKLKINGVTGVSAPCSFISDGKLTEKELYWYEWVRDVSIFLRSRKRPELTTYGAAFGFPTDLGRQIGWRTDFRRGEDGAMAVELKKFGKLIIIMNRKFRVRTTSRTLDKDGNVLEIVKKRLAREFSRIKIYVTSQKEYKDTPSNMI
jgi:glycosyltransferase involved in cell wall biosynthesis